MQHSNGPSASYTLLAAAPWQLLVPDLWVDDLEAVDLDGLRRHGIRCLLVDIDNTLIPWVEPLPDARAYRFVERARRAGLQVVILSNARRGRRAAVAAALGVPAVRSGFKPRRSVFLAAAALVGCRPEQAAVVGDQLWTDVLGGRRAGMFTILVDPLGPEESLLTRAITRPIERAVLRWLARRGRLPAARVQARLAGRRRSVQEGRPGTGRRPG
ncbi:MAG: YqeG family HAD IIIA-type phosphatase [Limnochordaceae bacterium]|nr:YqeG family HAD IIIA-type phosphatase [Limnochordaceae bacterium]